MNSMKALSALALFAAPAAFLLAPLSFELCFSLLFVTGVGAIAMTDYARVARPLRVAAPVEATVPRKERFGLAA
jgi:hypothetical protein